MDNEQTTSREMVIVVDSRVLILGGLVLAALLALVLGILLGQQSATRNAGAVPGSALGQQQYVVPQGQAVSQVPAQIQLQPDSAASDPGGLQSNSPAPDFGLSNLDGQTVRLSDLRGKPVIVNFWATWCPPCKLEMPTLEAVYQKYKDKGLVVLGVNTGERVRDETLPGRVKTYAQQLGIDFPIVLDTQDTVADMYRLRAYPTSYFVDVNGNITDMRRGAFLGQSDVEHYLAKIIK